METVLELIEHVGKEQTGLKSGVDRSYNCSWRISKDFDEPLRARLTFVGLQKCPQGRKTFVRN